MTDHTAVGPPTGSPDRTIVGRHAVAEQLRARPGAVAELLYVAPAGARLAAILAQAQAAGVAARPAAAAALARLAPGSAHQGIAARLHAPFAYAPLAEVLPGARLVVVLDQIQDPHNVGAIARTALALGADALVVGRDRACGITPGVVRAAAGATAHLPICQVGNLRQALAAMRAAGLWTLGLVVDPAAPTLAQSDLDRPLALVVGGEGPGLRPGTVAACDMVAMIPMALSAGSLNASCAAAVALYEVARQRPRPAAAKQSA